MRKFAFIVIVGIVLLSGCSTSKDSMTDESTSKRIAVDWSDTLPLGFEQITSLRSEEILFPEFAYKILKQGTYDCPVNQPYCAQVTVISAKGCPSGIFATIVGRTLKEQIYTDRTVWEDVDMTPPIFSQVDDLPLEPNEKRVLRFKEGARWNDPSILPGLEVIGCND